MTPLAPPPTPPVPAAPPEPGGWLLEVAGWAAHRPWLATVAAAALAGWVAGRNDPTAATGLVGADGPAAAGWEDR